MAFIANATGPNGTIKWQAEPDVRGTYSIISTCIITLFLCIWSCVHLNLPKNGGGRPFIYLRRCGWVLSALIFPEYLLMVAWSQRQAARKVTNEVGKTFKARNEIQDADLEARNLSRKHPWTMTHSFWAIMGGIAIDPSHSNQYIPSSQRTTITGEGLLLLLKHEPQVLPDVPEGEVKDKSKGSSLTKLLACLQAGWFCLSCLARVSQKLPLSMLELNTFAHALCAVIVYILWWKKPLDVEQPFIIHDDQIPHLLAFMWMASKTSCIPKPSSSGQVTVTVGRDPEFEAIIDYGMEETNADPKNPEAVVTHSELQTNGNDTITVVTATKSLPGTGFRSNPASTRWVEHVSWSDGSGEFAKVHSYSRNKVPSFRLTPCDVQRWQLAKQAMIRYEMRKPDKDMNLVTVKAIPEFMEMAETAGSTSIWAVTGLALVTAAYGGLHALAWNGQFPSPREKKLWHISTLVIASPAALMLLVLLLNSLCALLFRALSSCLQKRNPSTEHDLVTSRKSAGDVTEQQQQQQPSQLPGTSSVTVTTTVSPASKGKKEDGEKKKKKKKKHRKNERRWMKLQSFLSTCGSIICEVGKAIGYLGMVLASSGMLLIYFPARIYLIWESLRTVFYLTPDAYQATNWPSYLPHIT